MPSDPVIITPDANAPTLLMGGKPQQVAMSGLEPAFQALLTQRMNDLTDSPGYTDFQRSHGLLATPNTGFVKAPAPSELEIAQNSVDDRDVAKAEAMFNAGKTPEELRRLATQGALGESMQRVEFAKQREETGDIPNEQAPAIFQEFIPTPEDSKAATDDLLEGFRKRTAGRAHEISRGAADVKAFQKQIDDVMVAPPTDEEKGMIARRDAAKKISDDLTKSIDREIQSAQEMVVNPNRFQENLGFSGKLLATLSLMLGGLGAGLQGGAPNQAILMLHKRIEQDIDAQKANMASKDRLISQKQGILSRVIQQIGTEEGAIQIAEGIRYKQVAAKIDQLKAGVKNAEAISRMEAMGINLNQIADEKITEGTIKAEQEKLKPIADFEAKRREAEQSLPPGVSVQAGKMVDKEARTLIRNNMIGADRLLGLYRDLEEITTKDASAFMPGDMTAASEIAKKIEQEIIALKAKEFEFGTLQPADVDFIKEGARDATRFGNLVFRSRAREVMQRNKQITFDRVNKIVYNSGGEISEGRKQQLLYGFEISPNSSQRSR